jgi:hypothetical protein
MSTRCPAPGFRNGFAASRGMAGGYSEAFSFGRTAHGACLLLFLPSLTASAGLRPAADTGIASGYSIERVKLSKNESSPRAPCTHGRRVRAIYLPSPRTQGDGQGVRAGFLQNSSHQYRITLSSLQLVAGILQNLSSCSFDCRHEAETEVTRVTQT